MRVLWGATALSSVVPLSLQAEALKVPNDTPSATVVTTVAATTTPAKPDPLEGLKTETAKLQAEKEKIMAQIALEQAKLDQKMTPQKLALAEMQSQIDQIKTKLDLADLKRQSEEDPELLSLRRKSEKLALQTSIAKNESDMESFDIRREENVVKRKTGALALQMELQQKESEARTYAPGKEPSYLANPLVGNKLILSDRRIPLNGVVTAKTADSIVERISYFNNRDSEAPIFIVIDDCPGGSVMAGYKVLKAMNGSKAPVYTVVKSFAASLAACITTLSKRSFAYPNAIILHHQLSAIGMGNLTQQREAVKELEEWWKRLASPIAEKMGITREEFITKMYEHSSSGDWNEFADNAQKLKWVDTIVEEIEETSLLRHPDSQPAATGVANAPRIASTEAMASNSPDVVNAVDDRGKPMAVLPRLNPLDAYWLYNPDGYFRGR